MKTGCGVCLLHKLIKYGISVFNTNSELRPASVNPPLYNIACDTGLRYDDTRLHQEHLVCIQKHGTHGAFCIISYFVTWWRHQMETFSALLAICAGNSLVTGEFAAHRPVTRSFDIFFDLCLKKRLSKQSWRWWFETLSRPLWRHYNEMWCTMQYAFYCCFVVTITLPHGDTL